MNSDLQTRLTTLETTLSTLLSTLPPFTPPLPPPSAILASPPLLSTTLNRLAARQASLARSTARRAATRDRTARKTATLKVLAEARARILATPVAPPALEVVVEEGKGRRAGGPREVPFEQILEFAREIARFGPPVGYHPPGGKGTGEGEREGGGGEDEEAMKELADSAADGDRSTAVMMNGGDERGEERTSGQNGAGTGTGTGAGAENNPALLMLSGAEKAWLDPERQKVFLPWPSDEMIQKGVLVRLQAMVEQGVSLEDAKVEAGGETAATAITAATAEGEPVVKSEDETKETPREAVDRRPAVQREKPKVFGTIDLYVPDEEP